ncbi:MAG TPA: fused MFS/spermidine synthase [Pseudolabrys sp.]
MPATPSTRLILATYTVAVFLSALLLFAVQPMFTRMVLPQLGGSPSVWSIAMVFFQTMLLAGYAYAHWLAKIERRIVPVIVHVALLIAAGLTLPLAIAKGWGEPPASGTEFWLLGLFAVSIGLPFFALAANNPLLQAWFVRTGHSDGKDPYFLYAASNVGSFLALLSYPILIEPIFTVQMQSRLWSVGFALLTLLIVGCGFLLLRAPVHAQAAHEAPTTPKPSWRLVGRWVFVSAVPSGLLVAVTAHISTDIGAAPLMWVMPLSLYLLTWVLVFARKPVLPQSFVLLLQPAAIAGVIVLLLTHSFALLVLNLLAHLLTFFIITMACHGELARTRPHPAHLTAFYVALSFGGMLGGLFAGLVAPYTFNWIAEYPILVFLAVLCRPPTPEAWAPVERFVPTFIFAIGRQINRWFWPVAVLVALALILPAFFGFQIVYADTGKLRTVVFTLAGLSILFMRDPPKSALIVAVALSLIRLYPTDEGRTDTLRSFFGVNLIYETQDHNFRVIKHGSTLHGAERLLTDEGKPPEGKPQPLTYYHAKSAMKQTIDSVRWRKGGPIRVAIIGLGAGSLVCWIEPNENWKVFEIDPTVIMAARDPKRFTFVSSCKPDIPIVLGDARLTLAKEPDGLYDLIIVDAYSSDAIPIHLATQEAMTIYKAKLAPHGVVTMHISNRHLELESVVVGIATANDLKAWVYTNDNDEEDDDNYIFGSDVVIAARAPEDIGPLNGAPTWLQTAPTPGVRTWTDDYSNIIGTFWRKQRR